jgi:DNA-binding transcriptional MerR regulator
MDPSQEKLRVAAAARRVGVSTRSLRRWTDAGRIPCYRTPDTPKQLGHRLYTIADLDAFVEKHMSPPQRRTKDSAA